MRILDRTKIILISLLVCISGYSAEVATLNGIVCEPSFVPGSQKRSDFSKTPPEPWFTSGPIPTDQRLLEYIPVLAKMSRPNFDFSEWLRLTVDPTGYETKFQDLLAAKHLLRYHDYWKDRVSQDFYRATAKRLLELGSSEDVLKQIDSIYRGVKDNPTLLALLHAYIDSPRFYLELLSYLGPENIPLNITEKIKTWMTPNAPSFVSSAISITRHSGRFCGRCNILAAGHRRVLVEKRKPGYGRVVFIYVQGTLVGSIKVANRVGELPDNIAAVGDPSLLALTNVFDRSGKQILYAGGVYKIQPNIIDRAVELIGDDGTWAEIRTNRLEAVPLQFLGSDYDWTPDTLRWHHQTLNLINKAVEDRR